MDANLSVALDVIKVKLDEAIEQGSKRLYDYGRADVQKLRDLLEDAFEQCVRLEGRNK